MILSKHVTIEEFERSETAIKHGISNKMGFTEKDAAILLCEKVFEPIREHLKRPIKINSGFRSLRVNSRVGGSVSSQHVKGEAFDLDLHDKELFDWIIENVVFDQQSSSFVSKLPTLIVVMESQAHKTPVTPYFFVIIANSFIFCLVSSYKFSKKYVDF